MINLKTEAHDDHYNEEQARQAKPLREGENLLPGIAADASTKKGSAKPGKEASNVL